MSTATTTAAAAPLQPRAAPRRLTVEIVPAGEPGPGLRLVVVANLSAPRHASSAMKAMSADLPLDLFSLNHCKRIRKNKESNVLQLLLGEWSEVE